MADSAHMGLGVGSAGRRNRTSTAIALAAVVATAWALFGGGVGAARAEGESSAFVEMINASRQRLAGLEVLARAGDLDAVAARHAAAMADRGGLFHNPNLSSEVQGWSVVAENVGVGHDVAAIHQAFLDSPSHRANVLDGRVTEVGLGVVAGGDGRLWVVEVFRKPAAAGPDGAAATTGSAPRPAALPSTSPSADGDRSGVGGAASRTVAATDAARRAAAEARSTAERADEAARTQAADRAEAQAAAAAAAESQAAAAAAAEIAAVAATVDFAADSPYVPSAGTDPLVVLSSPVLVSSSDPAETTGRPAVAVAGLLWLAVVLSLLRRLRSDVVQAATIVRRLAARTA